MLLCPTAFATIRGVDPLHAAADGPMEASRYRCSSLLQGLLVRLLLLRADPDVAGRAWNHPVIAEERVVHAHALPCSRKAVATRHLR